MKKNMGGRVALVTGAASGIGRATAELFAKKGASVVVSDVDEQGGKETVDQIIAGGGTTRFIKADVSSSEEVEALISETIEAFGRLDYACNNAGIEGKPAPTAEVSQEIWQRVIDVNLTGVWLTTKFEIQQMLKRGQGAIVNVASILGKVGFAGAPAYVAAKHGVVGLTKSAALEYAAQGIRVNSVCPAFIETPMLKRAGLLGDPEVKSNLVRMHPVQRLGLSEEVAEAIVWLCSDAASFVTGHAMLVDGGYTAQ